MFRIPNIDFDELTQYHAQFLKLDDGKSDDSNIVHGHFTEALCTYRATQSYDTKVACAIAIDHIYAELSNMLACAKMMYREYGNTRSPQISALSRMIDETEIVKSKVQFMGIVVEGSQ